MNSKDDLVYEKHKTTHACMSTLPPRDTHTVYTHRHTHRVHTYMHKHTVCLSQRTYVLSPSYTVHMYTQSLTHTTHIYAHKHPVFHTHASSDSVQTQKYTHRVHTYRQT